MSDQEIQISTDMVIRDQAASNILFPEVPLNDLGLPTGYYRSDMIDMRTLAYEAPISEGSSGTTIDIYNAEDQLKYAEKLESSRQEMLRHAFVPLSYHEGFPTLPSGTPYWNQLDHEPIEAYHLLDLYLKLPSLGEGARSLSFLPSVIEQHLQRHVGLKELQELFNTYYWYYRAKSYDLFREAARRKQMELRALEVGDTHYLMAARMMEKLKLYLDNDEDFWDLLTPKVAIDMLKMLMQVQRVSAGLPAAGPPVAGKDGSANADQSFEVTLRTIAQANNEHSGNKHHDANQAMEQALADPAMADLAQELIIKMGAKS